MTPLVFHFYRRGDGEAADGRTPHDACVPSRTPLASVRARAEVVLRQHLDHLAFDISVRFPELEGEALNVDLLCEGPDEGPWASILVARREDHEVARRNVDLRTLDVTPMVMAVLRQHPGLNESELNYTMCAAGGAGPC